MDFFLFRNTFFFPCLLWLSDKYVCVSGGINDLQILRERNQYSSKSIELSKTKLNVTDKALCRHGGGGGDVVN